jgi:hypothetical protein
MVWRNETWKSCYETPVWGITKPRYETWKICFETIGKSFVTEFCNVMIAYEFSCVSACGIVAAGCCSRCRILMKASSVIFLSMINPI